MNFIKDNVQEIYRRYAAASIGSALAMSIYSMVDTIAVGHSVGTIGTAAMAVVTPVYGTQAFIASICGVGGSVLMTKEKARDRNKEGNEYFTASLLLLFLMAAATWLLFAIFHNPIFRFFGATDEVLPYVNAYADLIIAFWPVFLFMIYLAMMIRSDGDPKLAMTAVLTGGACNIFGDWFFCFPMHMGMAGAATATVIGSIVQVLVQLLHFRSEDNTIRIEKPAMAAVKMGKIISIGFGSGIIEMATAVLAILLNHQITRYGGVAALSVYGIIATCNALIQSMFGGLGQAVTPFLSANYSAQKYGRMRSFLHMAWKTCLFMELLFTAVGELFPESLVRLFTKPTVAVVALAPRMIRLYFLTYLFMGASILCIYILQSTLQGGHAAILSLMRGLVLSGALILLLPLWFGLNGIMIAIITAEAITAATGLVMISRGTWVHDGGSFHAEIKTKN